MNDAIQKELPLHAPYASFGGGCFWCLEMEFRRQPGVLYTRSGYEGGHGDNPTYEDVCSGATGHAETTEIYFDPEKTSYEALVRHFLTLAHDPTDLNGQGVDRGTQYRSVIFYHNEAQKRTAETVIKELEAQKYWKKPIVTTLEPQGRFWPAEEYHQQYYEKYESQYGAPHARAAHKMQKWKKQGR